MTELSRESIAKTTSDAERGQGCAVQKFVSELGYEDRFAALNAIRDENERHLKTGSTNAQLKLNMGAVTELSFGNVASDTQMTLKLDSGSIFVRDTTLYNEIFHPTTAKHESTCADK